MQDMASGVPFLLPVVIDDTPEKSSLVPEEFMRVQWTRMHKGAETGVTLTGQLQPTARPAPRFRASP